MEDPYDLKPLLRTAEEIEETKQRMQDCAPPGTYWASGGLYYSGKLCEMGTNLKIDYDDPRYKQWSRNMANDHLRHK